MPNNVNDPKHWRDRAAAMRALAATMKDAEAIAIMYRLADDYDKLANRTAQRQAYINQANRGKTSDLEIDEATPLSATTFRHTSWHDWITIYSLA
jgi:hypothetical protein